MLELWKPILEAKGAYEVSSCGRVRSLDRFVYHRRYNNFVFYKGKVLKLSKFATGYPLVALRVEGQSLYRTVHRLVAEAFLSNPNELPVVRHLDDIRTNNILSNLAWGTFKDNYQDRRCPHCKRKLAQ